MTSAARRTFCFRMQSQPDTGKRPGHLRSPLALQYLFRTLWEPLSFPKVTLPWLIPLSASLPSSAPPC